MADQKEQMKGQIICTKEMTVQPKTKNYDKGVCTGGWLHFPEKHYLPPGSIPAGATKLKVLYIAE